MPVGQVQTFETFIMLKKDSVESWSLCDTYKTLEDAKSSMPGEWTCRRSLDPRAPRNSGPWETDTHIIWLKTISFDAVNRNFPRKES